MKTWDKVNSGMIKMYQAEVLGKLPVIQHFFFGSILPYQGLPPPVQEGIEATHCGHNHAYGAVDRGQMGWGDCCGIPVPSPFGAAEEQRKNAAGQPLLRAPNIKPVPFD